MSDQPMVYVVEFGFYAERGVSSAHSSLEAAQATVAGEWQQIAEDRWEHTIEEASICALRLDHDPIAALRERNECVQAEADRLTMRAQRDRNRAWDDALLGIGYDQSGYPHVRRFGQ